MQQLPGHCAIHQRQYKFPLNPAVIPFLPPASNAFTELRSVNFHQRWKWCCSFWTCQDYFPKFKSHWMFIPVFLLTVAPCSPRVGLHFGVITRKKLGAFSRQRKLMSFYSELCCITNNPVTCSPLQMKTIKDKQLWSTLVTVAVISHPWHQCGVFSATVGIVTQCGT